VYSKCVFKINLRTKYRPKGLSVQALGILQLTGTIGGVKALGYKPEGRGFETR
jgi:hypothetical protein